MPIPFLPSVDLGEGPTESKDGLTWNQLSYLGCVHCAASTQNVNLLLQFLQSHVAIEAYVDVTGIESAEDIISVLDGGAWKVFVKSTQLDSLKSYDDRVIPVYSTETATYANGVLLIADDDLASLKQTLQKLTEGKTSPIFISSSPKDTESLVKLATESSAIPIIPATSLAIEKGSDGQISVPELIGGSWTSDRTDKLLPTVVTDERGIALGLVYSSQESLAESLKTGTGVYQSRKRGLWYKGATSGDTQELVRVSLDCDQDCLKFVVRQKGRGK